MTSSPAATTQPTIWEAPNVNAQVGDIIRKPFCPIARVIRKEIYSNGLTCLLVDFPNCDRHTEDWVLPTVEVMLTPAPETMPVAIEADNELPSRGDNGREQVQLITKIDKKLAAIFNDRPKQYQQFLTIREELRAVGIKVGKLINSREDAKGWRLDWDGDKAGLYWTTGDGWDVEALKSGGELTGNWEGFELMEHLVCNGVNLDSEDE